MRSIVAAAICALLGAALFGCTPARQADPAPAPAPNPVATKPEPDHFQRFLPVAPPAQGSSGSALAGAFALDTMTGQLCWTYRVTESTTDKNLPNIPDCNYLYHQSTP